MLLLAVSRFDAINAAFGRATGDAVLQAAARRIERHGRRRTAAGAWSRAWPAPSSRCCWRAPASARRRPLPRRRAGRGDRPAVHVRRSCHHARQPRRRRRLAGRATTPPACCAGPAPRWPRPRPARTAPVSVLEEGAESATARGDRLEVDLRRALDQDEIEIRFQPQVVGRPTARSSASRRSPAGSHPQYGELGAATLFSVAERSDYLVQLSDHVQRKALARRRGLAGSAAGTAAGGQHHRRGHRPPRLRRAVPRAGRAKAASRRSG